MNTRVTRTLVFVAAAGIVLVACGDDSDERSGTEQAKQRAAQEAPDARAAQRLETYLRQSIKDLVGSVTTKPGQVINDVQPADGKLKIYTLLNADLATDEAPAREVCRAAKASRVPEAKGAVLVDAGDALLRRC
jgi:hypothetical protein